MKTERDDGSESRLSLPDDTIDAFAWFMYCRAADERKRKGLGITDKRVFLGIDHYFNFVIASDE